MKKRLLRIAIAVLLTFALLGLASSLTSFSWTRFQDTLSTFDRRWVVAALGASVHQVLWQGLRLYVIFLAVKAPAALDLFAINTEGQFINQVSPLRTGDAYKVLRFSALGQPTYVILAVLLVERFTDIAGMFLVSGYAAISFLLAQARGFLAAAHWSLYLAVPALFVMLVVLRFAGARFFGMSEPVRAVAGYVAALVASMRNIVRPQYVIACLLVSVATWIADAGILYCSARSGGVSLELAQAVSSVFMLNVGIAVPLTIANTGVFEASLGYALTANLPSLSVERAVGIAAVHHFENVAGPAVCLVFLWGLKQARARSARRRLRAAHV